MHQHAAYLDLMLVAFFLELTKDFARLEYGCIRHRLPPFCHTRIAGIRTAQQIRRSLREIGKTNEILAGESEQRKRRWDRGAPLELPARGEVGARRRCGQRRCGHR